MRVSSGLPVIHSQRATGENHNLRDAANATGEAATMKAVALRIPDGLAVSCRKTPQRVAWLERLPDVLRDLKHRWSLTLDAPFDDEASCAYVAAAVRADATCAVLKLSLIHI